MGFRDVSLVITLTRHEVISLIIDCENVLTNANNGQEVLIEGVSTLNTIPNYVGQEANGYKYEIEARIHVGSKGYWANLNLISTDKEVFSGTIEYRNYQDNMCE